ncbi:hypothetical protein BWR19_13710 [Halomonas sp. 1513]|nr:phage holin family protein [Halomonas sp. 1513]APX93908.1 hypothetical protein BWR19_13710 [Halomonas sp. 1513]
MNQEHKTAHGAPASRNNGTESIADLIRNLSTDVSTLVGKEISLAKSEARESVSEVKKAVGAIATGAAIAMAGIVVLLISAVHGLSNVLDPWLAALIVGAAALLVGFLMVSSAKKKISANAMVPDRTLASTNKDKETLKRSIR